MGLLIAALGPWLRQPPAEASTKDLEAVADPPRTRPAAARLGWLRLTIAAVVVAAAVATMGALATRRPSDIRVRVLSEHVPFNPDALVYVLFEINKRQPAWHLVFDFDPFAEGELTSEQSADCARDPIVPLCYARLASAGTPFIGLTGGSLGPHHFGINEGSVSVISTDGWWTRGRPNIYDFLAYRIIVESVRIHLNASCRRLPANASAPSRTAYGDLFEFLPRRSAVAAEILTAHLTPRGEAMLLGCFGPGYMSTVRKLLDLTWLHSDPVRSNLADGFGVTT